MCRGALSTQSSNAELCEIIDEILNICKDMVGCSHGLKNGIDSLRKEMKRVIAQPPSTELAIQRFADLYPIEKYADWFVEWAQGLLIQSSEQTVLFDVE